MSQLTAACPNCGAPIVFRWSSSIQTVCEFCKSVLVRTDVDLRKVGQVADLPPDSSPIQIGTEGSYAHKAFVVIGRIIYEYELGTWNEWHLMVDGASSWWLSDAQDEYVVSALVEAPKLPAVGETRAGQHYVFSGVRYTVSTITAARYKGVQGELPFEYWDKQEARFVDLRSETGQFATIDYSEATPALYVGAAVEFDDLHLKNLRVFEGWR